MDAFISQLFSRMVVRPATAAQTSVTAGGSGDATEVNGLALNLNDVMAKGERSIAALIYGVATVADTKALTLAANWQQADDVSFSVNAEDIANPLTVTTVFTAAGAQTAKPWGVRLSLNYERVTRKYVRIQFTPDLTASGTDTATIQAAYVIGQAQELPPDRVQAFTAAA